MAVRDTLLKEPDNNELYYRVAVLETECMGACDVGPVMVVNPGMTYHVQLKTTDIPEIVQTHLIDGNVVEDKTYEALKRTKRSAAPQDIDIYIT